MGGGVSIVPLILNQKWLKTETVEARKRLMVDALMAFIKQNRSEIVQGRV